MSRKPGKTDSSAGVATTNVELDRLVLQKNQLQQQLERFSEFLSNMNTLNGNQINELQVRTAKFEKWLERFEEVQLEIQVMSTEETKVSVDEQCIFERQFYTLLSSAKGLIASFNSQSMPNNTALGPPEAVNNGSFMVGARLPSLDLPKFNGDFEKWCQFSETFQTLVHNNVNLDEIQKFYYLLSCLEGKAYKVLEGLEISRSNYSVALEILKERFENKPLTIHKHIKSLVDMPSMSKESVSQLRSINDALEKHVRALRALGEPVDYWDRILIFLISRKIDNESKRVWEEKTISAFNGQPTLNDFTQFLSSRCLILETVEGNAKECQVTKLRFKHETGNSRICNYVSDSNIRGNIKCEICQGSHFVYKCNKLLALSIPERSVEVRDKKLCFNCLRSSHMSKDCRSSGCRKCGKRHNSLLHRDLDVAQNVTQGRGSSNQGNYSTENVVEGAHSCSEEIECPGASSVVATSLKTSENLSQILLSTAIIYIKNNNGLFVKCRALLDSGSQLNFISSELAKRLKLHQQAVNIPIAGITQMRATINYRLNSVVKSCHNDFQANLSFLILDNITARLPIRTFSTSELEIPSNLQLADPNFNVSSQVDLLIGAGLFFDLLCVGQIKLGKNKPILQKSVLGWIVSGNIFENSHEPLSIVASCHVLNETVQNQLEKFWTIEELDTKKHLSKEEIDCETWFTSTLSREVSGRFCVSLPIKGNVGNLGDSLENATNRFCSLEKRLSKNSKMREMYISFMNEYIELGHMSKIEPSNLKADNVFYLPHHCVFNSSSTTTKMRVVFDGSAKTSSGLSLNDVLKVGPCVQDDLFSILVRFRQYDVVITADIAKMYRQINIIPQQRDLQRILWRPNENSELDHYRLNTVTYGTSSASFLATRCLEQIAQDLNVTMPKLSKVISKCFYVDDLILSVETASEAVEVGSALAIELNKYGFPLRKWSSNQDSVLKSLSLGNLDSSGYLFTDGDTKKTLGVYWQARSDRLQYVINLRSEPHSSVTKRFILSVVSQIFDPLGLVGPVTIKAKILLQKLWQLKLGWDESLPIDLFSTWTRFYSNIESLNSVVIPRQITISKATSFDLHGFCDASENAYGACLYLRSVDSSGDVKVQLICAKSRVAPLKSISIPRLELCGALLLARLSSKILSTLDINVNKVFLWCDSTIVLSWLSDEPSRWKLFVANRVSEIQTLTTKCRWSHVASEDNPADLISRGVEPEFCASTIYGGQVPHGSVVMIRIGRLKLD